MRPMFYFTHYRGCEGYSVPRCVCRCVTPRRPHGKGAICEAFARGTELDGPDQARQPRRIRLRLDVGGCPADAEQARTPVAARRIPLRFSLCSHAYVVRGGRRARFRAVVQRYGNLGRRPADGPDRVVRGGRLGGARPRRRHRRALPGKRQPLRLRTGARDGRRLVRGAGELPSRPLGTACARAA